MSEEFWHLVAAAMAGITAWQVLGLVASEILRRLAMHSRTMQSLLRHERDRRRRLVRLLDE